MKYLRAVASFLIALIVYLGLPLLGWGINDLPGFFFLYPRLGYAVLMVVLALAVGYQAIDAPEGFRGSRGDERKRLHRQSVVVAVVVLLLFGALFFLPFADRSGVGVMIDSQGSALARSRSRWVRIRTDILVGRRLGEDVQCGSDHPEEPSIDHDRSVSLYPASAISRCDLCCPWFVFAVSLMDQSCCEYSTARCSLVTDQRRRGCAT